MQNSGPELNCLTDEELVQLAQSDDNPAFAELVSRHYTCILKLALSILRDRQDAEDEVQNACWKAFQHIHQFQRDARFSTWLTRIVVNQCLMRIRQARRARFVYLDDWSTSDVGPAMELRDRTGSPESELGQSEVAKVLESEIGRIPPLLRSVFVLRDVQQLSMHDVACRLNISVAAAKSRLLRARIELRARLQRHQGRLGVATLMA